MGDTLSVENAVPILHLEEVVIGSQFTFSIQFERLISENPDVFVPFDFTGMTLQSDLKLRPSRESTAAAQLVCTARDDGWVDLYMDGEVSGALTEHPYQGSLKVWPTAHPEQGDTLVVLILPMKYLATR